VAIYEYVSRNGRARGCYDNVGNIVDALDKETSSTSDCINPRGSLPYDQPGHHPVLSHWVWDKLYRFACCKWTDDLKYCIDHYNHFRPTPRIQDYEGPGIGREQVIGVKC
jgi:hypothetical protein